VTGLVVPDAEALTQLPSCRACGIYFLWHRGVVVYVGQSKSIRERVYQHIVDQTKAFDAMSFVACGSGQLSSLERRYIKQLLPRYNRCGLSQRLREERSWMPHRRNEATAENVASFLGLTADQFAWLRAQPDGPRKARVPRKNLRYWSWYRIEGWVAEHGDLLNAARQT
jgi:hypothetical protein